MMEPFQRKSTPPFLAQEYTHPHLQHTHPQTGPLSSINNKPVLDMQTVLFTAAPPSMIHTTFQTKRIPVVVC
jgi:hypothetical protein